MAKLYALKIRKSDLELITLLNSGITPEIEKTPTYFIFDATWNSDIPNELLTERQFLNKYEIKGRSPLMLAVKETSS